jgi:hypothetical protein
VHFDIISRMMIRRENLGRALVPMEIVVLVLCVFPVRADVPTIATKGYVDSAIVHAKSYSDDGPAVDWTTVKAKNWVSPHWGDTWEVMDADNTIRIEGVAACLGANSSDTIMTNADKTNGIPNQSGWGQNCWCRIFKINNSRVVGAWVFLHAYGTFDACYAYCPTFCSFCVRFGSAHSCPRAALLTAL